MENPSITSPQSTLRLTSYSLPSAVILVAIIQIVFPYKGWMLLLVGLGGVWFLSYIWALGLSKGIRFRRELRFGWAKVGGQMLERFTIFNDSRFPALWVRIFDHSGSPGFAEDRVMIVDRQSYKSWIKKSLYRSRGKHSYGPTSLHTSDPFGLYQVDIHYSVSSKEMFVLPRTIPLPQIAVASGEMEGKGRLQAYNLDPTISIAGIREYTPGDRLQSIHWAASAKRDDLYVRLFDDRPMSDWWIVLDMDRDVQFGKDERSTEETGVILAASLAEKGLKSASPVGLITYGKKLVRLPPKVGNSQNLEIMRSLAVISPGNEKLSNVIARTQPLLGYRSSLVLITSAVNGEWLNSLPNILRRGTNITILLMEPLKFSGDADAKATIARLSALGITYYMITPNMVHSTASQLDSEILSEFIYSLYQEPSSIIPLSGINWEVLM